MSKKLVLKKQQKIESKRQRVKTFAKVFLITFGSLVVLLFFSSIVYGQIASRPSSSTVCIKSEKDAQNQINSIPEVKKYFKKLNNNKLVSPYLEIDMPLITGNETKTGTASVGEKSENNSKNLFAQYVFVTGCGSKIQKSKKIVQKNFSPLQFDYVNKVALKTYQDETKICLRDLTKVYQIDFDKDGQKETLYGCVTGGTSNNIDYYVFKDTEGVITQLDQVHSSGSFEEIADFNKDGYPDIATSEILMDEGDCKDAACYVPIGDSGGGKYLLKRSVHHLWNPDKHKFDNPIKSEIYYMKDGKKITVKQQ